MVLVDVTYHEHTWKIIPGEVYYICTCGRIAKTGGFNGREKVFEFASLDEIEQMERRLTFRLAAQAGLYGPDGKPLSESIQ